MECKYCGSENIVKWGTKDGVQKYHCKDCGHYFFNNDKYPRMRTQSGVVATSLDLYFEGLSLRKTQKQIAKIFKVKVNQSTIWRWILKYSELVNGLVSSLEPSLSGDWFVDETALKFRPQTPLTDEERAKGVRRKGDYYWYWQIVDKRTRYLVATHISSERPKEEVIKLFRKSLESSKGRPKTITTDGLQSYRKGIKKVFYSRYKERRVEHIRAPGITSRRHNNMVERMHGTTKDRFKVMRGLKTLETPVIDGFNIHYNFVREHSSIGKTPAQASHLDLPFDNCWDDLIQKATIHRTQNGFGDGSKENIIDSVPT